MRRGVSPWSGNIIRVAGVIKQKGEKKWEAFLVDFDGAIDLSNEPVTGEEANGTREEEHENCHNYRVTKVQNGRCRTLEG